MFAMSSPRKGARVLLGYAGLSLLLACGAERQAEAVEAEAVATEVAATAGVESAASAGAAAGPEGAEVQAPYTVECASGEDGAQVCTVDKKTFIGWRTYHAFCHVCHAQDAVGSTFAPSLVDRLAVIDKERFLYAVAEGYTGQIGVMPPWKDNPNISKRYEELYAYLKARSDGVLSPGRPKRFPKN